MNLNNKCTILVSSCDGYSEAWYPFFYLLDKYWKDCKFPKVISTESKQCTAENVKTILTGNIPWSNRLKIALKNIESEYILFMLEDFFLQGKVNGPKIDEIIEMMDNDSKISCVYLKPITDHKKKNENYLDYYELDKDKKYIICFQVAIWRKKDLIELIPDNKTAWYIEENMTLKDNNNIFLCVKNGCYTSCHNDIMPYLWAKESGYGICKSKWLWNNHKLFKRENIDFKFVDLKTKSKFSYMLSKYFKILKNIVNNKGQLN